MKEKGNAKAYLAWIVVCIVWGTTYLAIRVGVNELPPMLFAGIRWIIAGTMLMILLNLRGYTLPRLNEIKHLAIVGIALIGLANGLVVVAEQWLPSGLTALIISTLPFWMVGFESFLPKGPKLNYFIVIGLLMGTAGVVLIFFNDLNVAADLSTLIGSLCLIGAIVSWALGSIYWKYKQVKIQPLMGASVQMLIAGILQTMLGFILGENNHFNLTQDGFIALAYLVVFGSILGYVSYIYAIEHLPLSLVSTYAYVNPIIALVLGWYILDEMMSVNVFIAAVLILAGVMVVKRGSTLAAKKMRIPIQEQSVPANE
jgi:drug/metabolite transporter (DMT)-like permease